MKSLYVLLALAGMGWGQAKIVDSPKNEHISYSDKIVFVGPHESKCSVKSWNNKDLVWETASGNPLTCKVDATGTGFFCKVSPEPEPIDVPAVHAPAESHMMWETNCGDGICHSDTISCSNHGTPVEDKTGQYLGMGQKCENGWQWSCQKGSHRILLQDEDGDWHCVKFGEQEKKK